MTLRQVIAFLLSCVIYGHVVTAMGIVGVSIVFGATFLRIYCSYRIRKNKQAMAKSAAIGLQSEIKT
jgi:adenosine 3'-phospho 5'-phosphosulfate transporter B2